MTVIAIQSSGRYQTTVGKIFTVTYIFASLSIILGFIDAGRKRPWAAGAGSSAGKALM